MANEKLARHLNRRRIEQRISESHVRFTDCCAAFNYDAALEAQASIDRLLDQLCRLLRHAT